MPPKAELVDVYKWFVIFIECILANFLFFFLLLCFTLLISFQFYVIVALHAERILSIIVIVRKNCINVAYGVIFLYVFRAKSSFIKELSSCSETAGENGRSKSAVFDSTTFLTKSISEIMSNFLLCSSNFFFYRRNV